MAERPSKRRVPVIVDLKEDAPIRRPAAERAEQDDKAGENKPEVSKEYPRW